MCKIVTSNDPSDPTLYQIRLACPKDLPALAEVYIKGWQAAYRGIVDDHYLDSLVPERWIAIYRPALELGEPRVGVLLADGVIVGGVSICPAMDNEACMDLGSTCAEVESLYLLPEYRRLGLGGKLYRWALDTLWELGFRRCAIWMFEASKNTQEMHVKFGMHPDGRRQTLEFGGRPARSMRMVGDIPCPAGKEENL